MKKKNKILTLISSIFGIVAICGIFACSCFGSRKNTSVSAFNTISITTNNDFSDLSVDSFILYGENQQKHSYSSSTMVDSSFIVGYTYYVNYNYRYFDDISGSYVNVRDIVVDIIFVRYQYNGVNYFNLASGTSSFTFDLPTGSLPNVWIFEVDSITLNQGSSVVDVNLYMRLGDLYNNTTTLSCDFGINAPVSSTFYYSYGLYDYVRLNGTFNDNLSENTTSYNVGYIDGGNATYQGAYDTGYNYGYDKGYGIGYTEGNNNGIFVGKEQGYTTGYNDGYNDGNDYGSNLGYSNGYEVGYSDGSTNGFDTGYAEGVDSQIPVIQNAYSTGYGDGYAEAYNGDQTALTIFSGILQIAFVPINFFLSIFNFEILGVNLSAFIRALFTVAITIIVVKLVMGGSSKGE